MTGYGRYEQTIDGWLIGVEVKIGQSSLFGIYRQISERLRLLENKLKSFVQHKIGKRQSRCYRNHRTCLRYTINRTGQ